jgi:hypothetical protein
MHVFKKVALASLLLLASSLAHAVTNAQVFSWAAATYPGLFSGPAVDGNAAPFDYRFFTGSGNVVAVDTSGTIYVYGPVTGNTLLPIVPVSAVAEVVAAWLATQPAATRSAQMGGARQGPALAIATGGGVVTTLAGTGSGGFTDGAGASASFKSPTNLTSDGTNLYVADADNNRVRKIVIATGVVSTLAGSGSPSSDDGTGTAASFYGPTGITTDGTNLYVTEHTGRKIRKVVIASGVTTTVAGNGGALGELDIRIHEGIS